MVRWGANMGTGSRFHFMAGWAGTLRF